MTFRLRLVLAFAAFLPICLMTIQPAAAHVAHAEPGVEDSSVLYQVFLVHDWIHPFFFLLMIYSCYYFRFFYGRHVLREPRACLAGCSKCYRPEGRLKQYHRYFFWITLILTIVHLAEISPSIGIYYSLSGLEAWILLSEGSYLGFAVLYLVTCFHFRYLIERLAHRKWLDYRVYNSLSSLNRYHHVFFWLTVFAVAVRFTLVLIDTGSLIEAIPGTF